MTLTTDARNAEVLVTPVTTEIDMATGDLLARHLHRAGALRPDRVVVDLSAVTFCDSTAISVLLSAREALEAHGCALVIRNPPRLLRRVAGLLDVAETLGIPSEASSAAVDQR